MKPKRMKNHRERTENAPFEYIEISKAPKLDPELTFHGDPGIQLILYTPV